MNIEFKFNINERVTTLDGRQETIEMLCYEKNGVIRVGTFYRLRLKISSGIMDIHKNYSESELLPDSGWLTDQEARL